MGNKYYSDEAVEFATEILDTINEVKDNFECDFTFNLEMILRRIAPALSAPLTICSLNRIGILSTAISGFPSWRNALSKRSAGLVLSLI